MALGAKEGISTRISVAIAIAVDVVVVGCRSPVADVFARRRLLLRARLPAAVARWARGGVAFGPAAPASLRLRAACARAHAEGGRVSDSLAMGCGDRMGRGNMGGRGCGDPMGDGHVVGCGDRTGGWYPAGGDDTGAAIP